MEFIQTELPDRHILRQSYVAGWSRYQARFCNDDARARPAYVQGPLAMARLVCEHAGESRDVVAAVSLAGPAVFSHHPVQGLNAKLYELSGELMGIGIENDPSMFCQVVPLLSVNARLFLQASAVIMMESMATQAATQKVDFGQHHDTVSLYSAARGGVDTFGLDTRFEIATMKVLTAGEATAVSANQSVGGNVHLWNKVRPSVTVQAGAFKS